MKEIENENRLNQLKSFDINAHLEEERKKRLEENIHTLFTLLDEVDAEKRQEAVDNTAILYDSTEFCDEDDIYIETENFKISQHFAVLFSDIYQPSLDQYLKNVDPMDKCCRAAMHELILVTSLDPISDRFFILESVKQDKLMYKMSCFNENINQKRDKTA